MFSLLQGVRVEVNGQVLSQGGNLGADRITDTTSAMQVGRNKSTDIRLLSRPQADPGRSMVWWTLTERVAYHVETGQRCR